MCQITAPPAVFLAGPLQTPGGWLLTAGVLAVIVVGVVYNYRKYLRQHPSALYRRVGIALLGGALLLLCTSLVIVVLVVNPSGGALDAWLPSQSVTLDASHCTYTAYTSGLTALDETYDRQLDVIATWRVIAFVFVCVGVGVDLIWLYWRARHPRAQSARQ